MRYLLRFIGACIYAAWKPTVYFISCILLFIWHGRFLKLTPKEMIKLEWEATYFYCSYLFSHAKTPQYVYHTFKDFITGKRSYIPTEIVTVYEYQNYSFIR